MINTKRTAKVLAGAGVAAGSLIALGADAGAFSQGPQYWAVNSTTGRFRHDAQPITAGSPDCVSDTLAPESMRINLRVDVPDASDISLGTAWFVCGDSYTFNNGVSTSSNYRGHFLQVRDVAGYGTLQAK